MSRPWMGYLAGAAFALSAAGAAAAYAQTTPAPKAAPAPGAQVEERTVILRRGDDADERSAMLHEGRERHVMIMRNDGAGHAEHLRTMLQLKPGQEAALTAYLAATGPQHHERIVEMSDHAAPKTTPQRLSEMENRMAEDTARSHARIEATRKFYDQLESSQKKVFDEMPMLMGPMGSHMEEMKVMVNMEGMPPMPPLPPLPPRPPRAPVPPTPHS